MQISKLQPNGRFIAVVGALSAAMFLIAAPGLAQQYPEKPIRIVVPFGPGGGSDTLTRLLQPKLREALGQPLFVENRPGAGTILGTQAVSQAVPDGYTLLVTIDQTMTMNPSLYSNLPYDPLKSFAPISLMARSPLVFAINPNVPVRSMKEFVDYLKANPGKVNYGSGAVGGQVWGRQLMDITGTEMTFIPYASGGAAQAAILKNEIQFASADVGTFAALVKEGKLVPLAISGSERIKDLPDVPTLQEQGIAIEGGSWWGMFAPFGTPAAIVEKLHQAMVYAVGDKDNSERFIARGAIPSTSSPEEFARLISKEEAQWRAVIQKAGIRAN